MSFDFTTIRDAFRDLVPILQFKNREKHPWSSVNFSKVAGFAQRISFRNSHSQVFSRKATLKKFTKFTGKYLRWRLVTQ